MGFQKIAGGLIAFSLLSAGTGFFLRGSYPITPSEQLEQVYPVTVSPLGTVFSYGDHIEEYASSFLEGEIIIGTPVSRMCSGGSIITTVQINQAFSGKLEAGKQIQVIEPYSLLGEMESTYCGYLPMMIGQEYLLNLSKASTRQFWYYRRTMLRKSSLLQKQMDTGRQEKIPCREQKAIWETETQ